MYLTGKKRMRVDSEDKSCCYPGYGVEEMQTSTRVVDYSSPIAVPTLLAGLDDGKYGSVTKDYEKVHDEMIRVIAAIQLTSPCTSPGLKSSQFGFGYGSNSSLCSYQMALHQQTNMPPSWDVIDLDVDLSENVNGNHHIKNGEGKNDSSVIVVESDEEDDRKVGSKTPPSYDCKGNVAGWLESQLDICRRQAELSAPKSHSIPLVPFDVSAEGKRQPSIQYEKVVLMNVSEKQRMSYEKVVLSKANEKQQVQNLMPKVVLSKTEEQQVQNLVNQNYIVDNGQRKGEDCNSKDSIEKEPDVCPSPHSSVCMHDQPSSLGSYNEEVAEALETDGLEDLWKDMSLAMECSKDTSLSDGSAVAQQEEDCIHSFLLEDDMGLVCRICGVIQKSIDTIFDYQWKKGTRSTRTYMSGSRQSKDVDEGVLFSGRKGFEHDIFAADISVHPRHMKEMRPHQIEGFNFLVRNLLADKPGGCILAHAPGSGKTFMLISFIQSFLARDPNARPLVILPKGILATWKKEFQRWQVDDIPLHDFYSSNATNRSQQLDILRRWEEKRSVLFLGYKQFATIVCGGVTDKISAACQERLLKVPSLLILDEGHTPRNESTNILSSLAKVQTPCKVVLSGTLFQNHVKEVFNILNLVRPKFLRMETSRAVVKRVMSKVNMSGSRRLYKGCVDSVFYDLVEETLQNDDNYKRRVTVIQDLRELTRSVLHYYKGDFLDELPGLVDFTVILKLSAKQQEMVKKLGMFEKFKKSSMGSAVYTHPRLWDTSKHAAGDRGSALSDESIDSLLDSMNIRDGVKTKFFLNILSMSDSAGEKVLVFSQYLISLKFLERLVVRTKGWRLGKEIFMISGDTSPEQRDLSMEQFNNSQDAKVFFGSIKACGEGISLVGASRVIILDVHLNPSVTRQAIGRAFRPGQQKKVYIYRLIAGDSPEEEDHVTSFRKELISKMWFEWSEYSGLREFELDKIDAANSQDIFLESHILGEDVKALYKR